MHDAYTPTFFIRHNRPLRAVMIDNQPWKAAAKKPSTSSTRLRSTRPWYASAARKASTWIPG